MSGNMALTWGGNHEAIAAWLAAAKKAIESDPYVVEFGWDVGSKFIRGWVIVRGQSKSAYCFIDQAGNLLKAEGWKRPNPCPRGHVGTVDPAKLSHSTGWLYVRGGS